MSQYEYYEFQAVDRRLTEQDMQQLRACSSRAQITQTSFTNEYHFGSFKGDEDLWMEKYFDGYMYNSHWGTRVLMLALPAKVLPLDSVEPFAFGDALSVRRKDGRVILKLTWHDEDYETWVATDETLSPLLTLREELAGGDYRSLYIGWLLSVQRGEFADDQMEPPVPANLSALSTTQARLVEFLRVDRDLLDAAAEGSPSVQPTQEIHEVWAARVKSLPNSEKDDALMQLLDGEPARIAMELRARFSGSRRPSHTLPSRRTAAELLATAEILGKKRKEQTALMAEAEMKRQQELAAQARRRHLDSLAGRESEIWTKIDGLIAIKQSRSYDEAVQLLKDLRDFAARGASQCDFRGRVGGIRSAHPTKRGLLDRLQREGL